MRRILSILALGLIGWVLNVVAAQAQTPITFHGFLETEDGQPVPDPQELDLTFRVWPCEECGDHETLPLAEQQEQVDLSDGLFVAYVVLEPGAEAEVQAALFAGQALWLGVQIGGDAEELHPRIRLGAGLTALFAATADRASQLTACRTAENAAGVPLIDADGPPSCIRFATNDQLAQETQRLTEHIADAAIHPAEFPADEAVQAINADPDHWTMAEHPRDLVPRSDLAAVAFSGEVGDLNGALTADEAVQAVNADPDHWTMAEHPREDLVSRGDLASVAFSGEAGDVDGAVTADEAVQAVNADPDHWTMAEHPREDLVSRGDLAPVATSGLADELSGTLPLNAMPAEVTLDEELQDAIDRTLPATGGLVTGDLGVTGNLGVEGSLGIGTASPTADLHVTGNLSRPLAGIVAVAAGSSVVTGSGTAFAREVRAGDAIKIGTEIFTVADIASDVLLTLNADHSAGAANETAHVDRDLLAIDDGAGQSTMVVNRSGNVRIGTTDAPSPNYRLDVAGDVRSSGAIRAFGDVHAQSFSMGDGHAGMTETPEHDMRLVQSMPGGSMVFDVRPVGGVGNDIYKEAMRILANGNVGIGTANPSGTQLEVQGRLQVRAGRDDPDNDVEGGTIVVGTHGHLRFSRPDNFIRLVNGLPGGKLLLQTRDTNTGAMHDVTVDRDGNVGIGTDTPNARLDVRGGSGRVEAGHSWLTNSDRSLKQNISTLDETLAQLAALRAVRYDLRDDPAPGPSGQGKHIGVIAQELEAHFPELVFTDERGIKSVAYDRLSAVALAAARELKADNDRLTERVARVEARMDRIESRLQSVTGSAPVDWGSWAALAAALAAVGLVIGRRRAPAQRIDSSRPPRPSHVNSVLS